MTDKQFLKLFQHKLSKCYSFKYKLHCISECMNKPCNIVTVDFQIYIYSLSYLNLQSYHNWTNVQLQHGKNKKQKNIEYLDISCLIFWLTEICRILMLNIFELWICKNDLPYLYDLFVWNQLKSWLFASCKALFLVFEMAFMPRWLSHGLFACWRLHRNTSNYKKRKYWLVSCPKA